MRLLWLSHTSALGGAELALAEGVRALAQRGHAVHVVLPEPGPLQERLSGAASVLVEPSNRWTSPSASRWTLAYLNLYNLLRAAPRLASHARALGVDVVVTNTLTLPAGALAARRAGLPHAWYIHEFGDADHGFRFLLGRARSLRLIDRLSDAILVNSQALAASVEEARPRCPVFVIPYAVDVEPAAASEPAMEGPFRLVLVGAKTAGKGQEDAVRAVAILAARGCDARLELVGGGDPRYEARLRRLCDESALGDRVVFVAFEPHPEARFARAHVALMCSRSEAFGRVTIEAMKLGRPVIGARAGATPELIREGQTGLLYAVGDAGELADRIELLYRDREQVVRMGRQASQWATQAFSRSRCGEALETALTAAHSRRNK